VLVLPETLTVRHRAALRERYKEDLVMHGAMIPGARLQDDSRVRPER
jgi:hypothetical protein